MQKTKSQTKNFKSVFFFINLFTLKNVIFTKTKKMKEKPTGMFDQWLAQCNIKEQKKQLISISSQHCMSTN